MMPDVSAGSNQAGASETWIAQVSWPAGPSAAAAGRARAISTRSDAETRPRAVCMIEPPAGGPVERDGCPEGASAMDRCQGTQAEVAMSLPRPEYVSDLVVYLLEQ